MSSRRATKGHPQGALASCVFVTASPPGMGLLDGEGHRDSTLISIA